LNGNNRKCERKKKQNKKRKKGKKTKKDSGGGRFHNYLIYRYIKNHCLILRQGSTAGTRKEL